MKKTKFDIFISYRHRVSYDRAQLLLQLLEDNGYAGKVSFDSDNLEGQFNGEIISRVDTSTDFIMLVHPETFNNISTSAEDIHLYEQLISLSENDFNEKMKQLKDKNFNIDYVRVELGRALSKNKNIIPVVPTTTNAFCFDSLKLPPDISGITGYQAVYYNDNSSSLFKDIMLRLLPKLKSKPLRPLKKLVKLAIGLVVLLILSIFSFYGYKYFAERTTFKQCRTYKDYIAFQNDSSRNVFFIDACKDSIRLYEYMYNHGYAYVNNNGGKDSISVIWSDNLSLFQLTVLRSMLDSMMYIKAGKFIMGTDNYLDIEGPAHQVTITKDYFIYKYEITRRIWYAIMKDSLASDPLKPVTDISWYDCQTFIHKLNDMTGLDFRLPTEAQWEFAALGGIKNIYSGSSNVDDVAYYKNNSMGMIHNVGQLKPNGYELYDMSGNVKEWCLDGLSGPYKHASMIDPVGLATDKKIVRGGDYSTDKSDMSVTYRDTHSSHDKADNIGFRIILILGKEQI